MTTNANLPLLLPPQPRHPRRKQDRGLEGAGPEGGPMLISRPAAVPAARAPLARARALSFSLPKPTEAPAMNLAASARALSTDSLPTRAASSTLSTGEERAPALSKSRSILPRKTIRHAAPEESPPKFAGSAAGPKLRRGSAMPWATTTSDPRAAVPSAISPLPHARPFTPPGSMKLRRPTPSGCCLGDPSPAPSSFVDALRPRSLRPPRSIHTTLSAPFPTSFKIPPASSMLPGLVGPSPF